MNVILKDDFPALGFVGDKVSVKSGYARNFLFPRGLAIEANDSNERLLRHALSAITSKRVKLRAEAEKIAEDMKAKKLEFSLKSGESGKTFGSITTKEIEAELGKLGFPVDRRRIKLTEPLKRAGKFTVDVRLHAEVTVPVEIEITIELIEEESKRADSEGDNKRGKRSSKPRKQEIENEEETAE